MNRLKITISGINKLPIDVYESLKSIGEVEYLSIDNDNILKETFKSCDVFWFRLNHKITKDIVQNARVKFILCAVTGLDHIDLEACSNKGIQVISLKNEFEFLKEIRATAEHTIGLMIALLRKYKYAFQHVENGNWKREFFLGSELYGKKIGILGMGRLGKIVGDISQSFGMNVSYYDVSDIDDVRFSKVKTLEELFSQSDIISIHVNYSHENHHLIDKDILKHSKKGIVIINTSRSGLIDEDALISFIERGIISGYASDVLNGEPKIKDNKLLRYAKKNENILISPHIGGNTYESIEKTERFILNKFLKHLND